MDTDDGFWVSDVLGLLVIDPCERLDRMIYAIVPDVRQSYRMTPSIP
jgi:hypothetical protein